MVLEVVPGTTLENHDVNLQVQVRNTVLSYLKNMSLYKFGYTVAWDKIPCIIRGHSIQTYNTIVLLLYLIIYHYAPIISGSKRGEN